MTKISARVKDSENISRSDLIKNIKEHVNNNNYISIEEANVNGLMVLSVESLISKCKCGPDTPPVSPEYPIDDLIELASSIIVTS